ncbi:MAG: hypothetical protein IT229_04135 [Flavobacteriales bacterium]|nr:hypothetical protein [Flavobacteriales bacterium]
MKKPTRSHVQRALITKLKKKLEKETDANVLKAIEILLKDDTKVARIRRRVTETAILSNEAIAKGEVHSPEKVRSEMREMIATYKVGKPKRSRRA